MVTCCVICGDSADPLISVTKKGIGTIVQFAEKREDTEVAENIEKLRQNNEPIFVHVSCRKTFTDKRKIKVKIKKRETRNSTTPFKNDTHCLFCNDVCSIDEKNPARKTWVLAKTS